MLEEYIQKISAAVDENRLLRTVQEISCFHRIQASPGFRAAANHCCDKLNSQGIDAQVLSYPAVEDKVFDTYPSFQEWSCQAAWCELSGGRRIADFFAEPISVIQKSIPCDHRDTPLPICLLDKGSDPAAYKDEDFTGKLVFVREDFNQYYWAVEEKNAAGIITDFVLDVEGSRSRYDQLDTLRYTSFWWKKDQKKTFGFVLSPREGDRLADELRQAREKGEELTAFCYIDSALYDGSLEDVTAFLPGTTEEEILLTAHLCHPRASANDNASGSSAAMEALRVIKELVEKGSLPPLKRGIRILLVPEFTGSYAYLEQIGDERKKIVAALNLDMVGGKQDGGYGPLTITDLPMATPFAAGDLAEWILEEIKKEVPSLNGEQLPMFNSYVEGFTGGSDHIIFTDPNVGIPSLMLGQWPDKFYHTSSDTIDRIDTHLLGRSCTLAASYAYALANLKPEDLSSICSSGMLRLVKKVELLTRKQQEGTLSPERCQAKVCRQLDYSKACVMSLKALFSGDEQIRAAAILDAACRRFVSVTVALTGLEEAVLDRGYQPNSCTTPDLNKIPVRVFTTLPQVKTYPENLTQFFYYIDGKRTLAEICGLLDIDTDTDWTDKILSVCKDMQELGYLTM